MDSKTANPAPTPAALFSAVCEPEVLHLFAFCYEDRCEMLSQVTAAFVGCGGWVLERRTVSATAMEYRFEVQLRGIFDLYGALLALGLELNRQSHAVLTDLCTCQKHAQFTALPGQIATFCLEIHFLADATLHSLLQASHGNA